MGHVTHGTWIMSLHVPTLPGSDLSIDMDQLMEPQENHHLLFRDEGMEAQGTLISLSGILS